MKKELLAVWKGKTRVKFEVNEDFDSEKLMQLVAYLRIDVFDDAENLQELEAIKSLYLESKTCPPISKENELKAFTQLRKMCIKALKQYPTTLS